jgi:pimeloyl-ACP methyl ester carboxylesterase
MPLAEDQTKQIEALCRAMPVSRMVDYGMRREAAELGHRLVRDGKPWDLVFEDLATEQEAKARAEQQVALARDAWHAGAASLIFAQMAFNADSDRKRTLYRRMTQYFERFAALSEPRISRLVVPYRHGRLFGWHFRTAAAEPAGSVIVFGGMSGWSTAYRSMAEMLCRHGLDCLLVDGPGQGDSRLEGVVYADADVTSGLSRFVDCVKEHSPDRRIGLWGNSFGGLLAALTACRDPRVSACCINGAPLRTEVPAFRSAQEQLAAMFGQTDHVALADMLASLAFDGDNAPLTCAAMVLEGGADPLVPAGTQRGFLAGNRHALSQLKSWPDGEHTLYNHPAERNELAARWFATVFAPIPPATAG